MGAFDPVSSSIAARLPGEVVQSILNLEVLCKQFPGMGKWVALNGRDMNRGDMDPRISAMFPGGVFTVTSRTLNAGPAAAVIAADSTNFLAPGTAGTSALQASPDGATWSTSATWGASTTVSSLIVAGTRYVIAGNAGDLSAPYVSNINQTAANQVAKANWTVTTGGVTTNNTQGLAYGATANAGSGRTVLCKDGSLATASALFYLNDGATAWSAASGGSSISRVGVCWTGQKFIALGTSHVYQTSTDGATWADAYFPYNVTATSGGIASDGNGTVVVSGITFEGTADTALLVSKDHGVTWETVVPQVEYGWAQSGLISYINGKFFLSTGSAFSPVFISADGRQWSIDYLSYRGLATPLQPNGGAYKSGVYCWINTGVTSAFTATEDMTKLHLPSVRIGTGTSTAGNSLLQMTSYLKVAI